MPAKLRTKLTPNQFYCVACRKRCTVKADDMCVVTFRNGSPALQGQCKCDTTVYKFIKHNSVDKMTDKYGEC